MFIVGSVPTLVGIILARIRKWYFENNPNDFGRLHYEKFNRHVYWAIVLTGEYPEEILRGAKTEYQKRFNLAILANLDDLAIELLEICGAKRNKDLERFLLEAARNGNLILAKYLIEKCYINVSGRVIEKALERQNEDMICYFLRNCRTPEVISTNFILAVEKNLINIVKFCLEELEIFTDYLVLALSYAAYHSDMQILKYLISTIPYDPDHFNGPLIISAERGYIDTICYLVENCGTTAFSGLLETAIDYGHMEIVIYCVENLKLPVQRNYVTIAKNNRHWEIWDYLLTNTRN